MVIYSLPIRSFIEKLPNKTLMTQPTLPKKKHHRPFDGPPIAKHPPGAIKPTLASTSWFKVHIDPTCDPSHRRQRPGKLGDFRRDGLRYLLVTSKKILKQIDLVQFHATLKF